MLVWLYHRGQDSRCLDWKIHLLIHNSQTYISYSFTNTNYTLYLFLNPPLWVFLPTEK